MNRRGSSFDHARRVGARFMGERAAAGGAPAFSYDDIPSQLLRINSLEGSLAFSGSVLTGVTDVSTVGGTVNVTGSPVYTAVDSGLNGAPSFTAPGVVAPNVDRAAIRFTVAVCYRTVIASAQYIMDGTSDTGRFFCILHAHGGLQLSTGAALSIPTGEPVVGRKIFIAPNDGAAQTRWSRSAGSSYESLGPQHIGAASGSGLLIGTTYAGGYGSMRFAFFMACSAAPSAPLLTALEAKLLTDFG